MSQHDYLIENQDGASFRADINDVLGAAVSLNSGATEPATPYAYMLWQDTTAGILKQRNSANTGWVTVLDAIAAVPYSRLLTSSTAQATTSGTVKEFTGIPSWVQRITVAFRGISVSSTAPIMVQLGTGSTTYTTSGYQGATDIVAGSVNFTNLADGFLLTDSNAAANVFHGMMTLVKLDGNNWVAQSMAGTSNSAQLGLMAGSISLAAALTAVRITTVGGTNTFDAGSVNILFE